LPGSRSAAIAAASANTQNVAISTRRIMETFLKLPEIYRSGSSGFARQTLFLTQAINYHNQPGCSPHAFPAKCLNSVCAGVAHW
jgi:hypothetical protein